jgi:hypothetical protein
MLKMRKKFEIAVFAVVLSFVLGACAANKKKHCDDCPKWSYSHRGAKTQS